MKVAFLTEMGFEGVVPSHHPNMRTEFSWIHALNAQHFHLSKYNTLSDFDVVFIIFPKGKLNISAEGSTIANNSNPASSFLNQPIAQTLKERNKKVYYIQEGPHWWWNEYDVVDQILFYNLLSYTDGIFTHNVSDINYYRGLFPNKKVEVIRSLLIEDLIQSISPQKEDKAIIGGNFCRWYGGFESYIVSMGFGVPIWAQTSHAKRKGEDSLDGLNHLPRLIWIDWMKTLSEFKYGVHLMPTVAAGTFSLNCGYFGIPVIGNEKVDTQKILHPLLSVDVSDVKRARELAKKLKDDSNFYNECSEIAKANYETYYKKEVWLKQMMEKI